MGERPWLRIRVDVDNTLRAILATPEGREALKALLTGDGPVLEAKATLLRLTYHGPHPDDVKAVLAAAVDPLDPPKEETDAWG